LKRICVFCGSSPGSDPEYSRAAQELGQELAARNLGLVYGGAKVGLMGLIAATVRNAGGEVIGVIPRELVDKEVAFVELPDLRVVGSMHERKALMAELADGFVALPGGLGTLEEFFEILTWAQLGMHGKPCGLLNVRQYYDHLMTFLDRVAGEQFIEPEHRAMVLMDSNPAALLDRFAEYRPPTVDKARWALNLTNNHKID
jgi:uncharacterized protein (TIGR00730 family)